MSRAIIPTVIDWEATDNFGNLMVAKSDARSLEELREDLISLIDEALHRTPQGAIFAVDAAYGEVAAPSGNAVTHILQAPWLSQRVAEGEDKNSVESSIIAELSALLVGKESSNARAQGPWEF